MWRAARPAETRHNVADHTNELSRLQELRWGHWFCEYVSFQSSRRVVLDCNGTARDKFIQAADRATMNLLEETELL